MPSIQRHTFDLHKKYVDYRYGKEANPANINRAEKAKKQQLMSLGCLYRYRKESDIQRLLKYCNENIVPKIYLSNPNRFNDPFDFREPNIIKDSETFKEIMVNACSNFLDNSEYRKELEETVVIQNWEDWVESFNRVISKYCRSAFESTEELQNYVENKAYEEHENMVKETRNKLGVSSFSESPNSLLLWSHYADNHQGICIEYRVEEFFAKIPGAEHPLIESLHPVTYTNDISHLYEQTRKFRDGELSPEEEGYLLLQIGLTKAKEWEYEKEWRLVYHIEKTEEDVNLRLVTLLPSKIYLGAKISSDNKEALIKAFQRHPSVKLIEMRLKDKTFELEEHPLN